MPDFGQTFLTTGSQSETTKHMFRELVKLSAGVTLTGLRETVTLSFHSPGKKTVFVLPLPPAPQQAHTWARLH